MNEKDSPSAGVVVTADRAQCLAKASDAPDAQLNAVYQSVRGKLDAAEVQ